MPTIGTNIENIHVEKKGEVVTITTTTSMLDYSGQGFAQNKQASLSTKESTTIFRKNNLFVNVNNNIITIKGISGNMVSFNFELLTVSGVKVKDPISFAQDLLS